MEAPALRPSSATASSEGPEAETARLRLARVLVELGELNRAELEVATVLERSPEHLEALSLLAKIKHMRGELSLAVACGAQIQARQAAAGSVARMHLESILHLAQDPERGAGEFLAVGQNQLVRKPTAYMALEEAFRHYIARRPNEARASCRQVARRHREKDRDVHKLAVLAESWICELTGALEPAAELLERLGQERGFETDIDRLASLVSLYERIGTREKLEAAVNIWSFLEDGSQDREMLGRLAVLSRRLGREEDAERYEVLHLTAYRRAMHRASFADVLRAAAAHFIPVERLRKIRFAETETPADATPRERAIASVILDDLVAAGAGLEQGQDVLEIEYQANRMSLEGSDAARSEATELYLRALRTEADDVHVIGWLLCEASRTRHPGIVEAFREPSIGPRAARTLEAALQTSPNDPELWWQLAAFFGLQPGGDEQRMQFERRAAALEQAALDQSRAIGRVLSAATYRFIGKAQGLIHEIWASRERTVQGRGGTLRREDILGNLTDEMKDSVRSIFLGAREYAQAKFPHLTGDLFDYDYSYKVTKEDETSGGTSAGLPSALAFLSLFLQRPIPQDFAYTGAVVTEAHDVLMLRPVGDIELKVDAAYHRNLRGILVPLGNQVQLAQSAVVPRAISKEMVRYASNLDEAVRLVFGGSIDF